MISRTRFFVLLTLLWSVLMLPFGLSAAPGAPLVFSNDNRMLVSGSQIGLYEDATSGKSLDDVIKANAFAPGTGDIVNQGIKSANIWLKLDINNASDAGSAILSVENPMLSDVAVYQLGADGRYHAEEISKKNSFYYRVIQNRNFQFKVDLDSTRTTTIYVKVHSVTQLLLPVAIIPLDKYNAVDQNSNLLLGLFFGLMAAMFLYNFFIFITVRDKSYFYYILYIFSVTFVQLATTGMGYKYIWPNNPWLEQHANALSAAFTAFTTIAFIRQFVQTKRFAPRATAIMWVFVIAYIATIFIDIYFDQFLAYNLLNTIAPVLSLYLIGLAAFIWFKYKYRPAAFFLFAWSVFLMSIIIFVMKDSGALPYNIYTVSALQIGSGIETILLAFALADRINVLKREKEESQAQAIFAAQENERLVLQQNQMLEQKVDERTQELKQSNTHLEKALDELKETQTQLVEQEKMASLGQLTAGIAHEINNPINFVTSNVKPLKRDILQLSELFDQVESLSISDLSKEEKQKQIQSLKEDADFDYLKEEIDILLSGIQDGSERTAEIVKGLRIFSRLDEDDLKRANMNEGLDSTLIIVNNLLNNRIEIVKKYEDLPLIECYPGKLNQVFLNILSNAIHAVKAKFDDRQGGFIEIATRATDEFVEVSLRDNGTGMSEETKRKLFEPFFTTKDVGEGTGLGLSIAYNTVKKHNGRINVLSKLGEGSEFVLQLPLKHEVAEQTSEANLA